MAQIFHRSTNTLSRVSVFGFAFFVVGLIFVGYQYVRSPYVTGVGVNRPQPIQFSHEHHVNDNGIDCRYCHVSVETSSFAGIPPTETCMNCHSLLWADSPELAPVRESWANNEPIQWIRVHDLPDHVYFNHSIHVAKGIGCESCHGRVDQMELIHKAEPMTMQWCLDCHRHPEEHVRPLDQIVTMGWQPPIPQYELGPQLVEEYNIQVKIDCWYCHR